MTERRTGPGTGGNRDPAGKVLRRDDVVRLFGRPRADRVVFTNGCFDLLHRGHVEYLNAARRLGDRLVLGLNGDASVRRLKGIGRPILEEADRAYMLASLEAVDAVTIFDEDTPHALIAALRPDVLVKGGDYTVDAIVGRAEVEEAGGRVVVLPFVPGRSTTTIIEQIRERPR